MPNGSRIETDFTSEGTKIQWKNPDNPLYRFGVAAFILFWLGGWVTGETTTAQKLWTEFQQGKPLESFLLFWLCGWTVGGVFAVTFLFTLLRGAGKSQLLLGNYDLTYKPGRIPISSLYQRNRQQISNPLKMFTGGKTISAKKQEITNLHIGFAGDQLRVTFDLGAQRIEVGEFLTEPEKEWLHKTIENWLR